jgi:hypothetical protein
VFTLPAYVGVSLMPVRLGMKAICRWIGAGIGRKWFDFGARQKKCKFLVNRMKLNSKICHMSRDISCFRGFPAWEGAQTALLWTPKLVL